MKHVLENGNALAGKDSLYASAVLDKKSNEVIIKLINASPSGQAISLNINGAKLSGNKASITILSADKSDVNTLDNPKHVQPMEESLTVKANSVNFSMKPLSMNVIKIRCTLKK